MNRERQKIRFPNWQHKTNRDWLKNVRKRWKAFRLFYRFGESNIMTGSAYYPKEVYEWLVKTQNEFEKMDEIMKQYYKNA